MFQKSLKLTEKWSEKVWKMLINSEKSLKKAKKFQFSDLFRPVFYHFLYLFQIFSVYS